MNKDKIKQRSKEMIEPTKTDEQKILLFYQIKLHSNNRITCFIFKVSLYNTNK